MLFADYYKISPLQNLLTQIFPVEMTHHGNSCNNAASNSQKAKTMLSTNTTFPQKYFSPLVSWKKYLLLCLSLSSIGCASHQANAATLVQDHQSKATIVIGENVSEQVRNAAQMLQQYIAKSTGATLPISTSAKEGIALYVGKTPFVAQQNLDLQHLDEDGFVLRSVDDKHFIIVGGSDWGTEFGVYDFLERYVGVRWLMPTEIGESVPKHATLQLPQANVREEPIYLSRRLSPLDIDGDTPVDRWARFNRARGRIEFHHGLNRLIPASKYAKTHPEFYPMINGKRYLPQNDADYAWQPNFSAPGIVDAAVNEIDQYFQAHPDKSSYSLGMNDSHNFDESSASKARRNGKTNFLGQEDVSQDYFLWANAVVAKVLLQHPGKLFGTMAYHNIAEPPANMEINKAIVPFITYERLRWQNPELRAASENLTERWAQKVPAVGWYDYDYGINYQLPRVWFHLMQDYLSWGAAHHVKHYYGELYPNFGTGPKSWVLEKLLWNPNQNVDALLDDWYQNAAGKAAAPKLKAYYAIWEKFWTQDIQHSSWLRDTGQWLDFSANPSYLNDVPPSYLTESDRLMDEALKLADTPERKARVAKLQEMWKFFRVSVVTYQAMTAAAPQSEAQAMTFLDSSVTALDAARQRNDHLHSFKNDPLYETTYGYIMRYPATQGTNWGKDILWHLLPWITKSDRVKNRLSELAKSHPEIKTDVALMLRVAQGEGTQLLQNADFKNDFTDWSIWDKSKESTDFHPGIFATSAGQGASVQGLQRGALMQTIPYRSGSFYTAVSYSVPQVIEGANATLQLQILDAADKTLRIKEVALPSANVPLDATGTNTVRVPFVLPAHLDNAKSMRVMLLLDGLNPDKKVSINKIGIYQLGKE